MVGNLPVMVAGRSILKSGSVFERDLREWGETWRLN